MIKKFLLTAVLGLIMVSLLTTSCKYDPDKIFSAQNYHKDLASLVESKYLERNDTVLISKLISWNIARGDDLNGFTYRSLKEKAFRSAEQARMDISMLRSCFEKERKNISIDSMIAAINPVWYINDTLKFYYANLLINGIDPESRDLERIERVIGEMISSDLLAHELIFKRRSFGAAPPYYNDSVADKKIIHFAFEGKRSLNSVISVAAKERYIGNGWKITEIP